MSYEIVITKLGQVDLDEIFVWYEEQKTALGIDFIYEFEDPIKRISDNPYHTSRIEAEARSASLKKFPYQIIYRINEQISQVRIIAIIHHHRDPEWFRQRLS